MTYESMLAETIAFLAIKAMWARPITRARSAGRCRAWCSSITSH